MPVTACPLDCPDTCSLEVTVDAGRITKIDAAPGNPLTQGFICQKVKHHAERVYGPDRVLTPLRAHGSEGRRRRSGPATWDDALDLVAERIREAPWATAARAASCRCSTTPRPACSPRRRSPTGCSAGSAPPRCRTRSARPPPGGVGLVFGGMLSADPHDIVHARHVVVWGANPTVSNTHLPPLVQRGASGPAPASRSSIPRRTAMAARADRHLAPLPGTDVVLALAVARHLPSTGLLDEAFLAEHANGVDELPRRGRSRGRCRAPPRSAACPPTPSPRFAEAYAELRPSFLRVGWGSSATATAVPAYRAVLALPVLAGHFGATGQWGHDEPVRCGAAVAAPRRS